MCCVASVLKLHGTMRCIRDGRLTHQSDGWVKERERRKERRKEGRRGLGEKEMGKRFRLLTDGCQTEQRSS